MAAPLHRLSFSRHKGCNRLCRRIHGCWSRSQDLDRNPVIPELRFDGRKDELWKVLLQKISENCLHCPVQQIQRSQHRDRQSAKRRCHCYHCHCQYFQLFHPPRSMNGSPGNNRWSTYSLHYLPIQSRPYPTASNCIWLYPLSRNLQHIPKVHGIIPWSTLWVLFIFESLCMYLLVHLCWLASISPRCISSDPWVESLQHWITMAAMVHWQVPTKESEPQPMTRQEAWVHGAFRCFYRGFFGFLKHTIHKFNQNFHKFST